MRFKGLLALGILAALTPAVFAGCTHKEPEAEYANSLTVSVTGGKIKGASDADGRVAIFKGIPYAAAPVGDLRWKAPQEVEEWDGDLDCTLWGANALQGNASVFSYWTEEFVQDTNPSHYRGGVVYSEDCLTLNIWSSYKVTKNKPVLVYIHGGGYNSGGASCEVYDGASIAKRDVVFVSIQYRVGALGYMATKSLIEENENASSGNYGLLDQIAALGWVKENIRTFGGDPDNVTVMGQSAGAGSVNALIASPLAEGLFSNAVSLSCYPTVNGAWQTAEKRCGELSLTYNNKKLSQMSCEELRAIPAEFLAGKGLNEGGPCIDNYVLKDTYLNTVQSGKANRVKLMTGNVEKDDLIMSFYKSGDVAATDSMLALQNALGKVRAAAGENDTYVYMFNRNVPKAASAKEDTSGARHSYELAYFLGNYCLLRDWTLTDYAVGEAMLTSLVSFCGSGNPSIGTDEWKANNGDFNYMNFGDGAEGMVMNEGKTQKVYNYYSMNY